MPFIPLYFILIHAISYSAFYMPVYHPCHLI